MKHTKEEIINALKVIKDECNESGENCKICPFFSFECGCNVANDTPSEWEITELPPPETWRALK